MHGFDDTDKPRSLGRQVDPLRSAPPVGRWVIWHGQKAEAVLRLAGEKGRPGAGLTSVAYIAGREAGRRKRTSS